MIGTLEVFAADAANVGEAPAYDVALDRLIWVDLTQGVLNEQTRDGERSSRVVTEILGGAVPTRSGARLAAIGKDGFGYVEDDVFRSVAPIDPRPDFRMNDAKPDSRGRLWGDRTHIEFEPGRGSLHVWDGVGPAVTAATGFTLPNGIGWSPDDRTIYLADSMARVVLAADFDADDARVGTFRTLVEIESGLPDGLAVDAEGCIWLAVWGGGRVVRISPAGAIIDTLELPVTQPSSCAFGIGGELFITSARAGLAPDVLAAEPHAGSVFVTDVGVSGLPIALVEDAA